MGFKNDFFTSNIRIIKCSGLWVADPDDHPLIRFRYRIHNIIIAIYFFVLFTPTEFVILYETMNNLQDLMKNLNMAMTHALACTKMYVWFSQRKVILDIIQTLSTNTVAEKIGDFDPDEIIKEDKKVKEFATLGFLSVAVCVGSSSCLSTFYVMFFDYEDEYVYSVDEFNVTSFRYDQKLPYYSWIPWDYKESRFNFGCAAGFQVLAVLCSAFIIVGFDTLFTGMIGYTSCQIKILQGAFRTIRERTLRRMNLSDDKDLLKQPPEVEEEMMKELNRCIKSLQVIFIVCEKLEGIFSYITLGQVLISLVVFCTCLYLTSVIPLSDPKFAVELIYLVAVEIQIYIYCYFGNKVTLRGEDVPLSLYESNWFAASESFKRSMLITMTRMRKPILLTIGKFSPLTLSTFVTIGRASYSFFAVLKNSN